MRFWVLAIVVLVAGCATSSGGGDWSRFSDGSLDAWLVREAVPSFADTLSQHPRFKNETIRVAVMTGDGVELHTDALSASLRDAIHSRLLHVPGLTLILEDSPQDCRTPADGYYLGLELTRSDRAGAQAQLRLFDIVERKWISGFTSAWRGELSVSQQRLAAKPEISENARGLRMLPFESGQSDLLAAELARDLACELHRRGDDEFVVRPARHTAAGLVAGNLAGTHGIAVAANGQLVLDTRIHEVGDGLYQVWAILTPDNPESGRTVAVSAYARAPLLKRPAMAEVQTQPAAPASATESTTSNTARVRAPSPGSASRRNAPEPSLLRKVQIVAPANYQRCSGSFWQGHGVARGTDAVMTRDDCFAVEFDVHPEARVFIVGLHADNEAVRLYPSSCSPGGLKRGELAARRFPADGPIGWDRRLGTEKIFIIAARGKATALRVDRLVRSLPAPCGRKGMHTAGRAWLERLDKVVERRDDEVSIEVLKIRHAPRREHAGT